MIVGDLIFRQHVEGLVGDEGKRQADIGRNRRCVHPVLHQHQPGIDAPLVGDLAFGAEVDALDVIGRAGPIVPAFGQPVGISSRALLTSVRNRAAGRQQMPVEQFPFGADFLRPWLSIGPKI